MTRLSFYGAAGTVTGSRFLLDGGGTRVLVDCGLFQGLKALRLRNWAPFPVEPASIDAVVLTHAHLDHSGWLPVLVRAGFRGPVYCTPPTADLTPILLADSGRIQEEDARYANRKGFSRHKPALPLYTEEDAARVTQRLTAQPFEHDFAIGGMTFRFAGSGHILGAAGVRARCDGATVAFSGDVGRPGDPLMHAPEPPPAADVVVMESTYGDRLHGDHDVAGALAAAVQRTVQRGGVVLVPAFAVGRAQNILYLLHELFEAGRLPRVPVFLNSPMAIDVVELYVRWVPYHRLSAAACAAALRDVTLVRSVDESKELNRRRGPMIIVAGAGMITGGRILHHLRAFGDDPRTTILIAGHQAAGTRGADLLAGAPSVKIHGAHVPIRAEVVRLEGLSAHADQAELLAWLGSAPGRPAEVHLVHGEPAAADTLRRRVEETLGVPASAAEHAETVTLRAGARAALDPPSA
jgi:metallo-beta-lactamase family protein